MKTSTIAEPSSEIMEHSSDKMSQLLPDWLKDYWIQYTSNQPVSEEVNLICRALKFAYELHKEQKRKSGEPYIIHPIAVATLLRDLGADKTVVAAGFLHDVVEDTKVTSEEIETQFGEEVRQLVDGVTKLSKEFHEEKSQRSNKTQRQAENLRRMFIAMAKDIRVVVVKLADRLHNMRTLEHMPKEKQLSIAKETLEIFAPLANRLGIGRFKWELEDLSFKYLEPDSYEEMRLLVAEKRIDRETRLQEVSNLLLKGLEQQGIKTIEIQARPKHLYSIHSKMKRQTKEFSEIYDLAAIRIIVSTNSECYLALSVIHSLFTPIPQRFKDYIGLPKSNNYQSLHTTVLGSNVKPVEVQIRTLEMHETAEKGIAAHWKYKEAGKSTKLSSQDTKFIWLRSLVDLQNELKDTQSNELKDPQEYMETIKDKLFEEDVYVFTPKGDIIFLPRQATPIDFAYRIHTEVGNHIKAVKINDKQASLSEHLQNGDIVEVITNDNSHPNLYWLNFVVTHAARNRIRQWHKNNRREENILRGRDLLEKELGKKYLESKIKSKELQEVAEKMNYQAVDDLYAAIAHAEIKPINIYNKLREIETKNKPAPEIPSTTAIVNSSPRETTSGSNSPILGIDGLLYRMARCCNPLPGEPIVGAISLRPSPVSIHCQGCLDVVNIPSERQLPLQWNNSQKSDANAVYSVSLLVDAVDRIGLLKDILARVSEKHINVKNTGVRPRRGEFAAIFLQLEVHNREELDSIMGQIKGMKDVIGIRRLNNRSKVASKD